MSGITVRDIPADQYILDETIDFIGMDYKLGYYSVRGRDITQNYLRAEF